MKLRLHRSATTPDWEKVPDNEYNAWQRLAARTNGYVTPANLVSIIGFAIVIYGLVAIGRSHYWIGVVTLIIGRLADLLDGWLADRTGTKSPLGELLDATIDKFATGFTIIVFIVASIAPPGLIVALALPHIIIAVLAIIAFKRGQRLHPSRSGKISMALAWCTLLGFVIIRAVGLTYGSIGFWLVDALAAVSVVLGLYAAMGYGQSRD